MERQDIYVAKNPVYTVVARISFFRALVPLAKKIEFNVSVQDNLAFKPTQSIFDLRDSLRSAPALHIYLYCLQRSESSKSSCLR
jgi:hypothetical protein